MAGPFVAIKSTRSLPDRLRPDFKRLEIRVPTMCSGIKQKLLDKVRLGV